MWIIYCAVTNLMQATSKTTKLERQKSQGNLKNSCGNLLLSLPTSFHIWLDVSCETENNPETILGVHCFLGFTVKSSSISKLQVNLHKADSHMALSSVHLICVLNSGMLYTNYGKKRLESLELVSAILYSGVHPPNACFDAWNM